MKMISEKQTLSVGVSGSKLIKSNTGLAEKQKIHTFLLTEKYVCISRANPLKLGARDLVENEERVTNS
jgi:hypothetical protein